MRYGRYCGIVGVLLLGATSHLVADSITFTVQTGNQPTTLGSLVEIPIAISGLTDDAAPSLGAYDLEINYNPLVLGDPTVAFGDPQLGDELALIFPSFTCTGLEPGCGLSSFPLEIVEVSFDPRAVLDDAQAGAFVLATIGFTAVGPGSSPVTLSNILLSDSAGDDLSSNLLIINGQVDVSGAVQTPEPSALLLLASSVAGMLLFQRFRASRS